MTQDRLLTPEEIAKENMPSFKGGSNEYGVFVRGIELGIKSGRADQQKEIGEESNRLSWEEQHPDTYHVEKIFIKNHLVKEIMKEDRLDKAISKILNDYDGKDSPRSRNDAKLTLRSLREQLKEMESTNPEFNMSNIIKDICKTYSPIGSLDLMEIFAYRIFAKSYAAGRADMQESFMKALQHEIEHHGKDSAIRTAFMQVVTHIYQHKDFISKHG